MDENSANIPVAVVGANGYTGGELLRLLLSHPVFQPVVATSRAEAGKPVRDLFPNLSTNLFFDHLDVAEIANKARLVFTCLPHAASAETVGALKQAGVEKIVDLSADFRYSDLELYEKVYQTAASALAGSVPYGLPEWNQKDIAEADLVAAPGCYVTSALLALLPLGPVFDSIVDVTVDAKSGVSGAGRKAKQANLLSELSADFYPYGIQGHRHESEIRHRLTSILDRSIPDLTFTPHLLPIARGICSTVHVKFSELPSIDLLPLYNVYASSPFVEVLTGDQKSTLQRVVGTNKCSLEIVYRPESRKLIVVSMIDNLLKGASGQALQCANLMFGLEETDGLDLVKAYP